MGRLFWFTVPRGQILSLCKGTVSELQNLLGRQKEEEGGRKQDQIIKPQSRPLVLYLLHQDSTP